MRLLLLLALTGALGSMGIHMFAPAIPAVARDLHAEPATIQLAITLYLIALGMGQLIAGPIADYHGRRPMLLAGLVLFVAGSVLAALAEHAAVLLLGRIAQAFGSAAGIVAARSIVADLSEGPEAAARLAVLMTIIMISPTISPMIGGAAAAFGGWRLIFIALATLGLLTVIAIWRRLRETHRTAPGLRRLDLRSDYTRLLRNPRFCRFALANACVSCTMYIFLAGSSVLLVRRYGLREDLAGLCYGLVAASSIAGALAVTSLERRGGALRVGLGLAAAGSALMLVLSRAGLDGIPAFIGPMLLVGFGGGVSAPAGMAGAMHAEPGLAGMSSSLASALQMLISGLTTSLLTQIDVTSAAAIGGGICLVASCGLAAAPRGRAVA